MPVPIEQREIRGITGRQLFVVFAFLTTILFTVVGTYFTIKGDLKDNSRAIESVKVTNLQALQYTNNEIEKIKIDVGDAKRRISSLEINVLTLEVSLMNKGIIAPNITR